MLKLPLEGWSREVSEDNGQEGELPRREHKRRTAAEEIEGSRESRKSAEHTEVFYHLVSATGKRSSFEAPP